MLKSGKDYLEGLRDGRVVYIGRERVEDVTTHPAFRNTAQAFADFYDLKRDPAQRDALTYEEDGDRHSIYYMKAKTKDQLAKRSNAHRILAEPSFGLLGRSPDYIASFVTGMNLKPDLFGQYADNVRNYYRFMRDNDIFAAHAIVSPQASRDPDFFQKKNLPNPACRVIAEEDDGVVISGMKMLATGSALADEIWIGNILPLSPEAKAESITFAVPCNAKGVSLWSRKPFASLAQSEFEAPLTWRFDEADAMVMFDNVKVPWERVFVHNDPALSRGLYIQTAAHSYGNHHSNVRLMVKMQFLVGLCAPYRAGQRRVGGAGGARDAGPPRRARSAAGGDRRRSDRGLRGMAGAGLCHLQPAHDVCRAELGRGELLGGDRHAARTLRRRHAADAGRRIGAGRRRCWANNSAPSGRRRI